MNAARKGIPSSERILVGSFTKRDAARKISEGTPHLFSIREEDFSSLCKITERGIKKNKTPRFPWELLFFRKSAYLENSQLRTKLIISIIKDLKIEKKRDLRERVEGVLEELLTNAIYHASRLASGEDKYGRNQPVCLEAHEKVRISYAQKNSGVFLSVTDSGGCLKLSHIQNAFTRCYGKRGIAQIESKESGAGLGIYLVFESAMHVKITVIRNRETKISCWIAAENEKSSGDFSFNYYEEE